MLRLTQSHHRASHMDMVLSLCLDDGPLPSHTAMHAALHGICPAAAQVRVTGELGFLHRSIAHRCNPLVECRCLLELCSRARPHLPNNLRPVQHHSSHLVGYQLVRRRPRNPRRQRLEPLVVPPVRLGHLATLRLRQHLEGPCRGQCPLHRVHRKALLGLEEPLYGLHVVPRSGERCTEVVVRFGLVGPQGDGLAEGSGCSAPVLFGAVPRALSQQLIVLVARLLGEPGPLLRDLAILLKPLSTILPFLLLRFHLLVIRRVELPSARVPRALDAAPVRRRHLVLAALRANRMLLPVVVHIRRQPGAAKARETERRGRRRALLLGSGRHDGGLGLALRLQRVQRLANLLGARSQVWLLPQLGEQRLEAEVGISHVQSTHGLEKGVERAGFAHAVSSSCRVAALVVGFPRLRAPRSCTEGLAPASRSRLFSRGGPARTKSQRSFMGVS
eukprot:scaffold9290_cov63-Phaeocystis_antarctica.AAC.8